MPIREASKHDDDVGSRFAREHMRRLPDRQSDSTVHAVSAMWKEWDTPRGVLRETATGVELIQTTDGLD